MSFTCYACHARHQLQRFERLSPDEAVARDAALGGDFKRAVTLLAANGFVEEDARVRVHELIALRAEIAAHREVGEHEAWSGEQVWLPSMGVSVGPCEDCGRERPCVNL